MTVSDKEDFSDDQSEIRRLTWSWIVEGKEKGKLRKRKKNKNEQMSFLPLVESSASFTIILYF